MKRRAFLKLGATSIAGATFATGTVAADHLDSEPPSHVTLTFDEDALNEYRPRLVTRHLDVKPSKQYAWVATSAEYDTDAYCYWTWYVTQQGLTSRDSHYLDREPVYVFVDKETGDIREVVYSAYHWLAGRTRTPPTDADDHPMFIVAKNWHHYFQTTDTTGNLISLSDLGSIFESWLDNGWEENLEPGTAQNPWVMSSLAGGANRQHWWRDNPFGFSGTATVLGAMRTLGIRGADKPDV